MKKGSWALIAVSAVTLLLVRDNVVFADCAMKDPKMATQQPASKIKVLAANGGGMLCQSCIDTAAARWNGSCGAGSKPEFVGLGESSDITAFVRFMDGENMGSVPNCSATKCACASVDFDPSNGHITIANVRIWETAGNQDCNASATDILTHEFAHLLGIDDPPQGCDNCTNIMGSVTGPIDSMVCAQADMNFKTNKETASIPMDHPCHPQVA